MALTPHQRVERELTAYGLTFPETSAGPGWTITRALYVRKKMFAVFGEKGESLDALTLIMKLPISAEMAEALPFVRPARGWFKQHNWVTAHFGPDDDVLAEMETLKGWLKQSYLAVAPEGTLRSEASRRLEDLAGRRSVTMSGLRSPGRASSPERRTRPPWGSSRSRSRGARYTSRSAAPWRTCWGGPPPRRPPPAPAATNSAAGTNAVPAAPRLTRQQVEGRLRQLRFLFEEGMFTDEFYLEKVAALKAAE